MMPLYHIALLTSRCCAVLAVASVDALLDDESVDSVIDTEDVIVARCKKALSVDEKDDLRERFDEILHPLGFHTRLLVMERDNSIALYFGCLMLSAVMSLREQWNSGQLRDIVQLLFTFLSGSSQTVRVKRLSWPLTDYERCLSVFRCMQGNSILRLSSVMKFSYIAYYYARQHNAIARNLYAIARPSVRPSVCQTRVS